MTMTTRTAEWVARAALLMYLVAGLSPAGRFVFCVEGRWTFAADSTSDASPCADCIDPSPCAPVGVNEDVDPENSDCGCIDLVISQTESNRVLPGTSVESLSPLDGDALPVQLSVDTRVLADRRLALHSRCDQTTSPGTLDAWRTIVLRI